MFGAPLQLFEAEVEEVVWFCTPVLRTCTSFWRVCTVFNRVFTSCTSLWSVCTDCAKLFAVSNSCVNSVAPGVTEPWAWLGTVVLEVFCLDLLPVGLEVVQDSVIISYWEAQRWLTTFSICVNPSFTLCTTSIPQVISANTTILNNMAGLLGASFGLAWWWCETLALASHCALTWVVILPGVFSWAGIVDGRSKSSKSTQNF